VGTGGARPGRERAQAALCCAALLAATVAVYREVGGYPFVFDDIGFIVDNPPVARGLGAAGVRWAATAVHGANWQPLTWLLYMGNVSLFGLDAGPHHLVSLGAHCVASVALLLVLRALTGALWPAAFVAALFALHPLHVESVAWVTELKDPVSALFLLLGAGAWARYARRPGAGRYALVALWFALGLATKPIVVTLPLLLLLLDWWPLGRLGAPARGGRTAGALLIEKLPLFALAAAASAAAYLAQRSWGAVGSLAVYTPAARVANALVAVAAYLRDTVAPLRLAAFYPLRIDGWSPWQAGLGALLLLGASAAAIALRRRAPALLAGWGWFLATLLPVIGLVQVGGQARADRYMYLPLVGLGVAAAWPVARLVRGRPRAAAGVAVAAVAALALLGAVAAEQARTWSSAGALWRRALAVTRDNWVAHANLGVELLRDGKADEAAANFGRAALINPTSADLRYNWGLALLRSGRRAEAAVQLREALRIDPRHAPARQLLAGAGIPR
jgi:tetratricopeptide (TPR) repeat protein